MPSPNRSCRAWISSLAASAAVSMLASTALAATDGAVLGSGSLAFNLDGSLGDTAVAIAAGPDGTILQLGTVVTGDASWSMALSRVLPNGDPDSGFGTAGKAVNPLGLSSNSWGAALHLLPDGRILVAGTVEVSAGDHDWVIGRLLSNGTPDTSFGGLNIGFRVLAFDQGADATDDLFALAVDRSGRIVVVGTVDISPTDTDIGVARLTSSGLPDEDFSDDGWTTVAIAPSGGADLGLAVAIDNAGRIVAGGAAWTDTTAGNFDFDLALAVLDGAGELDSNFGSGGVFRVGFDVGGTRNELIWDLEVWPDGEIVAAGDFATATDRWLWFVLSVPPSSPHLWAGVNSAFCGTLGSPCSNGPQDSPRALLLQGDGKIVVGGFGRGPGGTVDFGAARLGRDLTPDTSFASDSTMTHNFNGGPGGDADTGSALAFDRDGRILVGGSIESSGLDTDFGWLRLDSSYVFADGFDWPGGWIRWSSVID